MKILSTGDLHFNAGMDKEIEASMDQIAGYASLHPVDLIAITGDVYERASEPASRNLAASCIKVLASQAPVLIIRGNHDAPRDLEILARLETENSVWVYETPAVVPFKGVRLIVVPWMTKARYLSLHPEASKEAADKTVSQLLLEWIKVAAIGEGKSVLIGHLTIAGAKAQNHQQLGSDGVTIGKYDLAEAGLDAALLGHIHLRQEIERPTYLYNGSIAPLTYGETPDKYFSVLDTDALTVNWVRLKTVHQEDVEAHWTPEGLHIDSVPAVLSGVRVRLNLRIDSGDNREAAEDHAASWCREMGALEFQINTQIVADSRIRSADMAKAVSMSDKLTAYWGTQSDPPDDRRKQDMLEKLSQLEEELCCP